jgi:hypothetical protein
MGTSVSPCFTDGLKIWAAYRAFELSQLATATNAGAGVGAAEDTVRVGTRDYHTLPATASASNSL